MALCDYAIIKTATKWPYLVGGNQNMNKRMLAILTVICVVILTGCQRRISPSSLHRIKIRSTKKDVLQQLGEPSVCRGSMINKFNQIIDVWEYVVDLGATMQDYAAHFYFGFLAFLFVRDHLDYYWLFFCDDTLVKWCKAGDWERVQHNIQEIRFR